MVLMRLAHFIFGKERDGKKSYQKYKRWHLEVNDVSYFLNYFFTEKKFEDFRLHTFCLFLVKVRVWLEI